MRLTMHTGNGYYRVSAEKMGELRIINTGHSTAVVGDVINHLGKLEDYIEQLEKQLSAKEKTSRCWPT